MGMNMNENEFESDGGKGVWVKEIRGEEEEGYEILWEIVKRVEM